MIDGQTNIFEMLYPKYKITTPIRIIELFGGYGSQLMALKRLNANVEKWKYADGDGSVFFDINTNPDDLLRILDKRSEK